MDKERLVILLERLKTITTELENELQPCNGSYVMSSNDYTEILKYVKEEEKQ